MPRLPELAAGGLTAAQQALHDAIADGPRGADIALRGPFAVWMHSPDFGLKAQSFGAEVRYGSDLPARVFELAVLACARHWNAEFEWVVHAPLARAAGVPSEAVDAIISGGEPVFGDPTDAAVFAFSRRLLRDGRVSEDVYGAAMAGLGLPRMIELVGALGYYSLVAMTLNAFEPCADP